MVDELKRTYHRLKMTVRRKMRRQKRQVEGISVQADDSLNRHIFKRFHHLYDVRRFVITWTLLVVFIGFGALWQVRGLDNFYLKLAPVSGGIYREGIIGAFTTANPLFAITSVDSSVSHLVFSGLFTLSPEGVLESDLATDFTVDEDGLLYTVRLRNDVMWHDGEQLKADDVVFTYERIKNPETKSPLQSGWAGVEVVEVDDYTVQFKLPNTLSSFEYSLVNGIIPKHVLDQTAPADLRSSTFNSVWPIGSGPFRYVSVEVLGEDIDTKNEKVTLEANADYYDRAPSIDGISIRTYRDEDSMLRAFETKEISAMVGLQSMPDTFSNDATVSTLSIPLSSQVHIFLNNSSPQLTEVNVRKALLLGTNTELLRQSIGYELIPSDSPFLKSHFTYDTAKVQAGYDKAAAEKLFDESGWIKNSEGIREKDGVQLKLRVVSQSLTEYATVVQTIQEQWKEIGVNVDAFLQPEEDVQSGAVVRHDYDVLLYGISLGPDPDIFAFWHSSQADPRVKSRLNLSEYKSATADKALEGGRTRLNQDLRKIKYQPFLDAWLADTPAIALYQPRFLFVVRGTLDGFVSGEFNSPVDRFYSVNDWLIRKEKVIK